MPDKIIAQNTKANLENKIYYSIENKAFYQSDFDKEIPKDAIEIDFALYEQLQNGLFAGLEIGLEDNNTLILLPAKIFYSASSKSFYHSQIHKNLPNDAVEIDGETYENLLNGQTNGQSIISDENGKPILQAAIMPSLSMIKSKYNAQIDKAAEIERLKYITAGDGQVLTYLQKANQALDYSGKYAAFLDDASNIPMPDENEYPLLMASLGIEGETLLQIAENITLSYVAWQKIGADIEKIRLKSKIDIDAATTIAQVENIFQNVEWPK